MAKEMGDPNEIRDTDIVFDCPFCSKSLAIDCRGAGLVIACPDCGNKVQVPIPEGMEIYDLDGADEDQEVRIIHMREVLTESQNRIRQLEADLEDLRARRELLEQLRTENAMRFEVLAKEFDALQSSLHRIGEVLTSAAEAARRTAGPSA